MKFLLELATLFLDSLFSSRRLTEVAPVPSPELEEEDPVSPIVRSEDRPSPSPESSDLPGVATEVEDYGSAGPIARAMKRKGYRIFTNDEKDLNLNIVCVRNPKAKLDEFDCRLFVFWKYRGEWKTLSWTITTFPGSRYLIERLLRREGAAILVPGQYVGIYKMDLHGGRYRALCQRNGAVRVYRDGNRDREFDMLDRTIQSGSFGINVHAPITVRAGMKHYIASRVYAASAGCQVFKSLSDFLEFRSLCDRAAKLWANRFTLTLLTDDDLDELAPLDPVHLDQFDKLEDPAVLEDFTKGFRDTVGVRNKNLLNVKQSSSNPWRYSTGKDARGHAIFPTYAKGVRAGIINLRSYWTRHKRRSIATILSRWAPESDTIGSIPGAPPNSPRDYMYFVSGRMEVDPLATLDIFDDKGGVKDEDQLFDFVSAMLEYEIGAGFKLPRAVFDEGLSLV